jgi:hypothetical protein
MVMERKDKEGKDKVKEEKDIKTGRNCLLFFLIIQLFTFIYFTLAFYLLTEDIRYQWHEMSKSEYRFLLEVNKLNTIISELKKLTYKDIGLEIEGNIKKVPLMDRKGKWLLENTAEGGNRELKVLREDFKIRKKDDYLAKLQTKYLQNKHMRGTVVNDRHLINNKWAIDGNTVEERIEEDWSVSDEEFVKLIENDLTLKGLVLKSWREKGDEILLVSLNGETFLKGRVIAKKEKAFWADKVKDIIIKSPKERKYLMGKVNDIVVASFKEDDENEGYRKEGKEDKLSRSKKLTTVNPLSLDKEHGSNKAYLKNTFFNLHNKPLSPHEDEKLEAIVKESVLNKRVSKEEEEDIIILQEKDTDTKDVSFKISMPVDIKGHDINRTNTADTNKENNQNSDNNAVIDLKHRNALDENSEKDKNKPINVIGINENDVANLGSYANNIRNTGNGDISHVNDLDPSYCNLRTVKGRILDYSRGQAKADAVYYLKNEGICAVILKKTGKTAFSDSNDFKTMNPGNLSDTGISSNYKNHEALIASSSSTMGFLLKDGTLVMGPVFNPQGEYLQEKYGHLLAAYKLKDFHGLILESDDEDLSSFEEQKTDNGLSASSQNKDIIGAFVSMKEKYSKDLPREVLDEEEEKDKKSNGIDNTIPSSYSSYTNYTDISSSSYITNKTKFRNYSSYDDGEKGLLQKRVYVFFDPLCPFSAKLKNSVFPKKLREAGVDSLWIPISVFGGSLPYGEYFLREKRLTKNPLDVSLDKDFYSWSEGRSNEKSDTYALLDENEGTGKANGSESNVENNSNESEEESKKREDSACSYKSMLREDSKEPFYKKRYVPEEEWRGPSLVLENTLRFEGSILGREDDLVSPTLVFKENGTIKVIRGVPKEGDFDPFLIEPFL